MNTGSSKRLELSENLRNIALSIPTGIYDNEYKQVDIEKVKDAIKKTLEVFERS
jgi:hypothetical protein